MTVRIEKNGMVRTIIHDRPKVRNAMDPKSADALTAAFIEFDADEDAFVAFSMARAARFAPGGISNTSVRSMLIIRSASSISLLPGGAAMGAKFLADRWGPLALSWTNRLSPP